MGKFGAPIVSEALVSFECELYATHEAGDHTIILGRVRDIVVRVDGEPLLFYSGKYHRLGEA
jgi:flavin reductase (DIM6/NTAB) family NADH-FMN oxidoreductase RutF